MVEAGVVVTSTDAFSLAAETKVQLHDEREYRDLYFVYNSGDKQYNSYWKRVDGNLLSGLEEPRIIQHGTHI